MAKLTKCRFEVVIGVPPGIPQGGAEALAEQFIRAGLGSSEAYMKDSYGESLETLKVELVDVSSPIDLGH